MESKIRHKRTYLRNKNRLTDVENRLQATSGKAGWGEMDWEFVISKYKLLYIHWINSKVLLYSTGNHIQYPVIIHNGEEYIYVQLGHFAVQQKLNTTS